MSKELFRGVVENLQKGAMTIEDMAEDIGKPQEFITREIQRIRQLPGFDKWIIYVPSKQTYEFVPFIKECPFDSIICMIKHFYNLNKNNMDMKMDLRITSGGSADMGPEDYQMIDEFLSMVDDIDQDLLDYYSRRDDFYKMEKDE